MSIIFNLVDIMIITNIIIIIIINISNDITITILTVLTITGCVLCFAQLPPHGAA